MKISYNEQKAIIYTTRHGKVNSVFPNNGMQACGAGAEGRGGGSVSTCISCVGILGSPIPQDLAAVSQGAGEMAQQKFSVLSHHFPCPPTNYCWISEDRNPLSSPFGTCHKGYNDWNTFAINL